MTPVRRGRAKAGGRALGAHPSACRMRGGSGIHHNRPKMSCLSHESHMWFSLKCHFSLFM
jgi:hypothetical protein